MQSESSYAKERRTRELQWIEMEERSLGKPENTRSSSSSNRQTLGYIRRNKTSVQSFRPNQHRGKFLMILIGLDVFNLLIKYNVEFPLFLSFVVAQICPPSQNYFPTAQMTDLSTPSPPSTTQAFNHDTPTPSYDGVRNQVPRGNKSSQNIPTHSTSKFDQLRYL